MNDATLLTIMFPICFEIIYFGSGFVYWWMDNGGISKESKEKYKLPEIHSTKASTLKIVFNVLRNHVVLFLLCNLLIPRTLQTNFNESIIATLIWNGLEYALFDIIFYFGHRAMHSVSWLRFTHFEHHNTYATIGLTGHYMEMIDFFFEVAFEQLGFVIILMPFGLSPMAYLGFANLGIFNTVVVHSGYDFFYLPDPRPHYLHHKNIKVNYSIGVLDSVFKTSK
eukprot:gene3261-5704_t